MPLNITLTPGHTWPTGQAITLAALRKAALPSVSINGSVGTGDISDGAITPVKTTPGAYWFGEASFVSNAYSLTLNPSITGYGEGLLIYMKIPVGGNNTIENPTLDVNGYGAKGIFRQGEGGIDAGRLRAGHTYQLHYNEDVDSAAGGWVMTGNDLLLHDERYATAGTSNAFTVDLAPDLAVYAALDGIPFWIIPDRVNTAGATLNINSLGAITMAARTGLAFTGYELVIGVPLQVMYDLATNKFLVWSIYDTMTPGISRNLRVTFPTLGTVDVDADHVEVQGLFSGAWARALTYRLDGVNITVDITGSGANGLDDGTEGTDPINSQYFVYVIYDRATDTVAGLLSLSADAPVMPPGYDYAALVGAVFNDGAREFDRWWAYSERWVLKTPEAAMTNSVTGSMLIGILHLLPGPPLSVEAYARCVIAEHGYVLNDTINCQMLNNTGDPYLVAGADETNVWLTERAITTPFTLHKTTGAIVGLTHANWVVYAIAKW